MSYGLIAVVRKGGFEISYLHVRQPVVTFGFEALRLLGGVQDEDALRGMLATRKRKVVV